MPVKKGGLVDITITKLTLEGTTPTMAVAMSVVSGKGLNIGLQNINGRIAYELEYKSGILSGTGSGYVDFSKINVDNVLLVTALPTGDPKVDLEVTVQKDFDLKVTITKGIPKLLIGPVDAILSGVFKDEIAKKVPSTVTPIIMNLVNKVLANVNLQIPVLANTTIVDMGLASDPTFSTSMVTDLRGSVYPKTGPGAGSCSIPLSQPLAAGTTGDMQVILSDTMVQCAMQALYEEGLLNYFELASAFLKVNLTQRLDAYGLGASTLSSPRPPQVTFLSNGVEVAVPIVMSVNMQSSPKGPSQFWLAVGLNVSLAADIGVKNATALAASVKDLNITVGLDGVGTALPPAYRKEVDGTNWDFVNTQLATAVKAKILPMINAKLAGGIGLPAIAGVETSNLALTLTNDALSLSTNIKLNTTEILSHLNLTASSSLLQHGMRFPTLTREEVIHLLKEVGAALGFNPAPTPPPTPAVDPIVTASFKPQPQGPQGPQGDHDSGDTTSTYTWVLISLGVIGVLAMAMTVYYFKFRAGATASSRGPQHAAQDPASRYNQLHNIQ
eukprot:TRINITY_DN1663_c0_g1_i1.p1 TRINITY_DN1663_c0_g1~~TRINITY_DN1663_c0_g1_i1.p1  ORF type:complete len:556 (+),score=165.57 TRINITY_DN1663_c0_g1_i1:303-1970(+)